MSRKFSVGDRVRVSCPESKRHGMECTVIRGLTLTGNWANGKYIGEALTYRVDLPPDNGYAGVSYEPHELIPLYDGNEKVSWSACEWAPKSLRVAS